MEARQPDARTRVWPLLIVVGAALGIKTAVLVRLGRHPLLQPLGELDSAFYVELGRTFAVNGLLGTAEPLVVAPLYAYFLAGVFALGGTIEHARLVQIVLGAGAVALIFEMARHWFGRASAWVAAALALLTGLFSFYETLILPAALDPFLVALTLAFLTLASRQLHWWPLTAAGVASGLFALNRPNALVYAFVLALWPAVEWWHRRRSGDAVRPGSHVFALPIALLMVLGANAARNYAASGEWVLVSSHGGLNFYIGNGPEADGTFVRLPGISPSVAGQARDAARVAEEATGRPLSAGEVSDYFYGRAWAWMVEQPASAISLWMKKAALVVNRVNVPLNFSYAFYVDESPVLRALFVGPWLLLPFGLAGLVFRAVRRTSTGYPVWAAFAPVYGLSVVAFFVSSRYRMPVLLPLCASAAGILVWGYQRVRNRQFRTLVRPGIVAVGFAVVMNWPLGLDDGRGFEQTRQAVWFVERGRVDEALDYVRRIAPSHSAPGLLHHRVGRALAEAGRFAEAVEQFRRSLEIDPAELGTRLELGQALSVTGRAAEAVPHLAAAVEGGERVGVAAPWLVRALVASDDRRRALDLIATWPDAVAAPRPEAALDLGIMALELGSPSIAERWLRMAVGFNPSGVEAHEHLGIALLLQERAAEAIARLEVARELDARRASTRLNLAAAYARAGRVGEARREVEEALRLDPAEPKAAALLRALPHK